MTESTLLITSHHKKDAFLDLLKERFLAVHVGKTLSNLDLNIMADNSGENISSKNKTFCELTAFYWAWKNTVSDYIGFMHYRRLFSTKNFILEKASMKLKFNYDYLISNFIKFDINLCLKNSIEVKNLDDIKESIEGLELFVQNELRNYDVVLPKKFHSKYLNVEQQYRLYHNHDDLNILMDLVKAKYPEIGLYIKDTFKRNDLYAYNMFIMKRSIFDDYCEKLFDILFELEKIIVLQHKNDYQKRLYGFLSERFFNIYIKYINRNNTLRIKELDTIFLKEPNI